MAKSEGFVFTVGRHDLWLWPSPLRAKKSRAAEKGNTGTQKLVSLTLTLPLGRYASSMEDLSIASYGSLHKSPPLYLLELNNELVKHIHTTVCKASQSSEECHQFCLDTLPAQGLVCS